MSETTHSADGGHSLASAAEKLCRTSSSAADQRTILYCHFDGFLAAISQRDQAAYRQQALAIVAGQQRSFVLSCSWEARQAGVRSGMPIALARRYCPALIVLQGDGDKYRRVANEISEIIQARVPFFEQSAIDQYYLDLSGMDRHIGGSWPWAEALQRQLYHETALPLSIGLANSKLVARVGALHRSQPATAICIARGQERSFLAPLAPRKLPTIERKTAQRLSFMGVRQIGVLAAIPPRLLIAELGQRGRQIWEHANAIDPSPLLPYQAPKSLYQEIIFPEDTIDMALLQNSLQELLGQLGCSLRSKKRLAGKISVKIQYTDGNTFLKSQRLSLTSLDSSLKVTAQKLLQALFKRRQRLRLLGVELSDLTAGQQQLDLFCHNSQELQLLQTTDRLRQPFGENSLL